MSGSRDPAYISAAIVVLLFPIVVMVVEVVVRTCRAITLHPLVGWFSAPTTKASIFKSITQAETAHMSGSRDPAYINSTISE